MEEGAYVLPYLDENHSRLVMKRGPISIATFLGYNLHGRARNYYGSYKEVLENGLHNREEKHEVVKVRSASGSTAYIWTADQKLYYSKVSNLVNAFSNHN